MKAKGTTRERRSRKFRHIMRGIDLGKRWTVSNHVRVGECWCKLTPDEMAEQMRVLCDRYPPAPGRSVSIPLPLDIFNALAPEKYTLASTVVLPKKYTIVPTE